MPDELNIPVTESAATRAFRAARDTMLAHRDDYDAAVAAFAWPDVGDHFNWAIDWFDAIARDNDKLALWLIDEDGTEHKVTFRQMAARSDAAAQWLLDQGVRRGDRVLLMLGNQIELWEIMLAIIKIGAVVMPTTTVLGPKELDDRVIRGEAAFIIANTVDTPKFAHIPLSVGRIVIGDPVEGWQSYSAAGIERLDATAVAPHPRFSDNLSTDPVLIYFTSGTTSKPKMVEHSHISYPVGHLSTLYWLGLKPGDLHLTISSPGWGKHAWSCFFAPWIAEATVFIYNYSKFDPAALDQKIFDSGVTTFCAPPTVWRMLINLPDSKGPGKLRELLSAGEPLNPEVIKRVRAMWGLPIRDGYGQTETTAIVGNSPGNVVKAGSMGKPLPGINLVLLDLITGELVPDGPAVEGEVALDLATPPTNLMTRYIDDEGRESKARRGGYFHTSDVASRDADGMISFIGRTDDVFKSSDYKVSPFEVESILIEHPSVAEAAVVPAPDAVRLNITKAYVHLAPGWEPTAETAFAILKHSRENLPPWTRVRRVEFAELPKTISGKIRRVELKEREQAAYDAGTSPEGEWRERDFPNLKAGPQR